MIDSSTYGAKMPRANWDFIGDLYVSFPNRKEQKNITSYIHKKTTQLDKQIEKIQKQIKLIQEYKQSLISKVVTGRLAVTEVNNRL